MIGCGLQAFALALVQRATQHADSTGLDQMKSTDEKQPLLKVGCAVKQGYFEGATSSTLPVKVEADGRMMSKTNIAMTSESAPSSSVELMPIPCMI